MFTFLKILGVLLCCLGMAWNHHLRHRRFRDIIKKVEECVARFTAVQNGQGLTRGWCPKTICMGSRLFAGYPSSTWPTPGPWVWEQSYSDTDWGSLSNSNCVIIEPSDHDDAEPAPPPLPSHDFRRQWGLGRGSDRGWHHGRCSLWAITKKLSGTYIPERKLDKIESSRSQRYPGSRPPTPQSPAPRPIPATRLKGGLAGVEQDIWGVVNTQMSGGIYSKAICLSGNTFRQILRA